MSFIKTLWQYRDVVSAKSFQFELGWGGLTKPSARQGHWHFLWLGMARVGIILIERGLKDYCHDYTRLQGINQGHFLEREPKAVHYVNRNWF